MMPAAVAPKIDLEKRCGLAFMNNPIMAYSIRLTTKYIAQQKKGCSG